MGILDDYKKDMAKEVKKKTSKNIRWLKFKIWFIKRRWWILGTILLILLVFFPVQTGTAIGSWITKFIGSVLQAINL